MFVDFLQNYFHWYGLIIGLAISLGLGITAHQLKSKQILSKNFDRVAITVIICGLLGARLWHVLTDWRLYVDDWQQALFIWRGGLSIFGAIIGGSLGLYFQIRERKIFLKWLDSIAIALPFAQSLGRIANYFNQELYGPPTNFPWAVKIDLANRLPGYEQTAFYHPLFFYESLSLMIFGLVLLWYRKQYPTKKAGSDFVYYLLFYSLLRLGLDFFRLGRITVWWGLGFNQWVMLGVIISLLGWWFKNQLAKIIFVAWAILFFLMSLNFFFPNFLTSKILNQSFSQQSFADHSTQHLLVGQDLLRVEIVNSPASIVQGLSGRSEIGADGMLFLMPTREKVGFWMVDMKFNLDIIWIDRGHIIGFELNVPKPAPNMTNDQLPIYYSPSALEWVLEVPAGTVEARGWQVGDLVEFSSVL